MLELNDSQRLAVAAEGATFLLGPAGAGKSTALRHRLLALLEAGEPAYTILTLVAEPEHLPAFLDLIHASGLGPYADLKILTFNRLAQEMVTLFWPLVARRAGFERPFHPPTVLNYDLAQLQMWEVVNPLLRDGAFANLRLRPQQIVSQLLDTLNRAALNGLTLEEAADRQIQTWAGELEHVRRLEEAKTAVLQFRRRCYQNSLLDLSLVVEVFHRHVLNHPEFVRYFSERFRHLLVDNVEEHTPVGQFFVERLMNETVSTTIAYDEGGGYKRFLAAAPGRASRFANQAEQTIEFDERFTGHTALEHLANLVANDLQGGHRPVELAGQAIDGLVGGRYRREMIIRLVPALVRLVEQGVAPADIAIIVPYLDGALRYLLERELAAAGLPYALLRRRSSPREEPRVRAWLTWLALAHPEWGLPPVEYDVAEALTLSVAALDPARAALAARHLYPAGSNVLLPVDSLPEAVAERVGRAELAAVEALRQWLEATGGQEPPDIFLHRLFNDLLSQPLFQPEPDLAGAAVCDWLVETAGHLRLAAPAIGWNSPRAVGRALIEGIYQGLVTTNPPAVGSTDGALTDGAQPAGDDGILIATIYSYLLTGTAVRWQVWLETAATGWWDIPSQPLSNAFVLAENRPADRLWTIDEDFAIRNELLSRIVRGLTNRCRDGVILATSDLDRRGQRQEGRLWRALPPALQPAGPGRLDTEGIG